jgi:hypothetical protein
LRFEWRQAELLQGARVQGLLVAGDVIAEAGLSTTAQSGKADATPTLVDCLIAVFDRTGFA